MSGHYLSCGRGRGDARGARKTSETRYPGDETKREGEDRSDARVIRIKKKEGEWRR